MLRDRDGLPATLFHGVRGSRLLHLDLWYRAEEKIAWDGDKRKATHYTSGFHVMPTYEDILRFSNRFRNIDDLVICEVDVKGKLRKKKHSPSNILLAPWMRILDDQWANRLLLPEVRAN